MRLDMTVLRSLYLVVAGLGLTAASQRPSVHDPIQTVSIPASRQLGLDMILLDADEMPEEPERARSFSGVQEEALSGAPIDLLTPVHHLYTDLRRQLVRYQMDWSKLPQVRIPAGGGLMKLGSSDPRLPILRERLGLEREGGFDETLRSRLIAFQEAHGLKGDGAAGAGTLEVLNRGAAHYERLIMLSMERARRLPAPAPGKYILVDSGSARLWMYENGQPVDSMKVIVGAAKTETPMMAALLRYASVNPYWNVPWDLVQTLIAPRVLKDGPTYLSDRGYEVLDSWEDDAKVVDPTTIDWKAAANGSLELRVRQLPGPANSMGDIKFMMPNEYGIYLHDTPNKVLFDKDDRWISNGCVRVEDARRLARWIFGEMPKGSNPKKEERVELETPMPVYMTYLTVSAEADGLAFRGDPYNRNAALVARFETESAPMRDPQRVAALDGPALKPSTPGQEAKAPEPAGKAIGEAAAKPAAKTVKTAAAEEKTPAKSTKPVPAKTGAVAKAALARTPATKASPSKAAPSKIDAKAKTGTSAKTATAKTAPAGKKTSAR